MQEEQKEPVEVEVVDESEQETTISEEEKEKLLDLWDTVKQVVKGLFKPRNLIFLGILVLLFGLALLVGYSIGWSNAMIKASEVYKDCIFIVK